MTKIKQVLIGLSVVFGLIIGIPWLGAKYRTHIHEKYLLNRSDRMRGEKDSTLLALKYNLPIEKVQRLLLVYEVVLNPKLDKHWADHPPIFSTSNNLSDVLKTMSEKYDVAPPTLACLLVDFESMQSCPDRNEDSQSSDSDGYEY